jgi:hypothetical protein
MPADHGNARTQRHVLILGASYGSLLATKLLMAGHRATLVCTRPTAELINREGTVVRFPLRERARGWRSPRARSRASCARAPGGDRARGLRPVVLGMQEGSTARAACAS